MARIIELNDLKAALVNVKMDVARFKIRRDRFPDFDFWIDLLNRSPGSFANPVTMHGWIDKQQFQTAMITFNIYNGPACFLTILPDTIGRALIVKGGIKLSLFGGLKMYDLGGLRIDRCQTIRLSLDLNHV